MPIFTLEAKKRIAEYALEEYNKKNHRLFLKFLNDGNVYEINGKVELIERYSREYNRDTDEFDSELIGYFLGNVFNIPEKSSNVEIYIDGESQTNKHDFEYAGTLTFSIFKI